MARGYDPSLYIDEILEWISNGQTLRDYCRQDGKPGFVTVYKWLGNDKSFAERFAHARDTGADVIAQECLEIADDASNDWMMKRGNDGREYEVFNQEHYQRSRLRIDTRLKLLAKWNPGKYGDRATVEHTGANGTPLAITFMGPDPSGLHRVTATKTQELPCASDCTNDDDDQIIEASVNDDE